MNDLSIKNLINLINLNKFKNKIYTIKGWIKNKRHSKSNISFLDINDGSCINNIQIIIKKKNINNYKNKINNITNGCSIIIKGKIKFNKKKTINEIHAVKINIIGNIYKPKTYPISSKYHSLKFLRNVSHLRPRTKLFGAITRIRNTLIFNLHKYLQKNNFFLINTPIITSLDTEGHSKMFELKTQNNINFFNKKSYLSVSGQLNLEAYACSLSKVYTLNPIFRAENSNTKQHLAEFWMLELEISFNKLKHLIKLSKNILSYSLNKIIKNNYNDLDYILKYNKITKNINKLYKIIEKKIIEINYSEIINILNKKKLNINWGQNISKEQENFLTNKYFNNAIIIKNFPKITKPFYMKINKDLKTVASMDIILPLAGETIGGSEREDNINLLDENIKNNSLNKKKYWWYRDLRKYGTIPHSGLGLGIERFLIYITKMKNIRDVIAFPKYPNYSNF